MALSNTDELAYEQHVIQGEKNNLRYYTERDNKKQDKEVMDGLFINLSLREIMNKWSLTFVNIINDLMNGNLGVYVLFKDDRMIYLGLTALFIAFSVYIIDITN